MSPLLRGFLVGSGASVLAYGVRQYLLSALEVRVTEKALLKLRAGDHPGRDEIEQLIRLTFRSLDHPFSTSLAILWQEIRHPLPASEPSRAS